MKKFEYKTKQCIANKNLSIGELNILGNEGWELINIISVLDGYSTYYYFKKEII